MKIYTQTFELSQPTPNRFWVAPHSTFQFGIKVLGKDGSAVSGAKVYDGETELTPEAVQIDGFDIYTTVSGAPGGKTYRVVSGNTVFTLMQVTTDSTVFEVAGEGGSVDPSILSAYATKTWVEGQISDFVTEDALSDFVTEDAISDFITEDALSDYVKGDEISDFITEDALSDYATSAELSDYAKLSSLNDKVTKAATGNAPAPNTLRTIFESDWATVSANADANTVYVVLPDGN